jgi:hypothetical protein
MADPDPAAPAVALASAQTAAVDPDIVGAAMADPDPAAAAVALASAQTAAVDPEIHKTAVLQEYRARVKSLASAGRSKPDMIAYSELKARLTPASTHGHVPGVMLGMQRGLYTCRQAHM